MPKVSFDILAGMPLVARYEEAFYRATGVTLKLVPAGVPSERLSFGERQNPFCRMISSNAAVGDACWASEAEAQRRAGKNQAPETVCCFAGLQVVAAPVTVGGLHVATWMGGQVLSRKPIQADFEKVASQLAKWGFGADLDEVRTAFFDTRVVETGRFQAMRQLLSLFAQHLGECADRLWASSQASEPQCVVQAKDFLQAHLGEPIRLAQVAAAAHLSPYHLCRVFRSTTGMTITQYLSRLRVEKAKTMLADPSTRVSEVAFATGFGSISQFNTVFRKRVGKSPTAFRESCEIKLA
jgi:AraC-like DNA-binding protein